MGSSVNNSSLREKIQRRKFESNRQDQNMWVARDAILIHIDRSRVAVSFFFFFHSSLSALVTVFGVNNAELKSCFTRNFFGVLKFEACFAITEWDILFGVSSQKIYIYNSPESCNQSCSRS